MQVIGNLKSLIEIEQNYSTTQQCQLLDTYDAQTAVSKGVSLLNMRPVNERTALGGKVLIDFEAQFAGQLLPAHKFRVGDRVEVVEGAVSKKKAYTQKDSVKMRGVVHKVKDSSISVVLEGGDLSSVYRLNRLVDDVSFKRMLKALGCVEEQIESQKMSRLV